MKKQEDNPRNVELIVGLKIPDTTAITALNALNRMGFAKIRKVIREDYYNFFVEEDIIKFKNEISNVDILVNANKNNFRFKLEKNQNEFPEITVAVSNIDDNCNGLISTLKSLGFKNIDKIERKALWTLIIDAKSQNEAKSIAEKAAENLLVNKHYQEYKILISD